MEVYGQKMEIGGKVNMTDILQCSKLNKLCELKAGVAQILLT